MNSPARITVVGTGNVASHLMLWLENIGVTVSQANPHTFESLDQYADICIISVSDNVIAEVAATADKLLSNPDAVIAHTSGTTPLSILDGLIHSGAVLYPLQTFTKGRALEYAHIPIFVEGATAKASEALINLAKRMTDNAREADSATRARLHLGAVFACNYLNYMLLLADGATEHIGLDLYRMLIEETVSKALEIGPRDAQTGPARRGDLNTLWAHMHLLQGQGHTHTCRVYRLLSQQILNFFKGGSIN